VRLVTSLARLVAGVIFYIDLRKCRGTSGESPMTLCAQNFRVRQLGNVLGWIGGVLGERSVAGFTIYVGVLAGGLHGDDVAVAVFAGGVSGVNGLACCDLCEGVSAIVSVLAEAVRNKICTESDEDENAGYEYDGKPQEVLRILEFCHPNSLGSKMNAGLWR
jgi:hypothetical protein